MDFIKTVGSSIHSPEFYSTLSKKSFKQGFRYFLLLILSLTLIRVVALINPIFIESPKAISGFAQEIVNCFPKDLELDIKNGQASSSAKQPYFVSCKGDQLAVIDTKTPYSSTQFDKYKVAVWVTKDTIFYKRNNVENRSYSLAKAKDFKLTKDVISSYQKTYEPYLKFVGPVLLLLTFVGIYLSYIFRLIHLLTVALIIWLLSKSFKQNLSYKSSYKIGLYAITLGLIVDLVVSLIAGWTHFYGFPFMVTILTLAVVFVNLFSSKNKS